MKPLGRPLLRVSISALLVAAAIALQILLPTLPPFIALLPAVLLAAFIGGRWVGAGALLATTSFAIEENLRGQGGIGDGDLLALAFFVAVGILSIILVDLHHKTVTRLSREQHRLKAALAAANAAVWEISPDGTLFWDEDFYRLVGLEPGATPPATATFLAMVHPEDRARMAAARRLMDEGIEPPRIDEYRLTRPDGKTIWLENHRRRFSDGGNYFIGITQDITRRKRAEDRVQALLREADHRAKNQFAVIMAVARETSRTTQGAAAFEEAFGSRLKALARSHDLMIRGDWQGTTLRELILAHLEPFGADDKCELAGPDITLAASAAQYLGMAFHELATNAAKHGSLGTEAGTISIAWEIVGNAPEAEFALTWTEHGAPAPTASGADGFGTKVLLQLVPATLAGTASRELTVDGLIWTIAAPLSALVEGDAA
jgi:PAS domain S-box-containing protein